MPTWQSRRGASKDLITQRQQTDQRLSTLRSVANSALALAPQSIKTRWKTLTDRLDQLPSIRSTIDAGTADRQHVYNFYNGVLDAATDLFDTQARVVPDVTATQGGIAATETFHASDADVPFRVGHDRGLRFPHLDKG